MLALEPASQSIPFRITEAGLVRSDKSRALVLHPRTLELLARHDIVQNFLSRGTFNDSIRIFANQKFAFEIDLKETPFRDTVFPNPLIISQAETETVLCEALEKYGVVVEGG
jgi:2-polyprenyl-6-methoxyphenol hydroxylase-like FAD-dependent oxidoreductase